ncbi:MAG: HNH endonuclease [Clostridia bacterium]|nr:HNH endonuclease [Clostridia bacterium]
MKKEKSAIISNIITKLLVDDKESAKKIISTDYPHKSFDIHKRSYTIAQKIEQFLKDGFVDRYTGERLLNPGILKVISSYFPNEFPFQSHWKMSETHIAYWDLIPTIDHIYPIAKGGYDNKDNWVTTSMKNNSIKSNYTIDEIRWTLYPPGNISNWDGLTALLIKIVEKNRNFSVIHI